LRDILGSYLRAFDCIPMTSPLYQSIISGHVLPPQ
jgi:hypothetical protein